MKKLFATVLIISVSLTLRAQEFNVGLSAAYPLGDANDLYSFGITLDAEYLYKVSEQIKVGGSTGYLYNFGKDFNLNLNLQDSGDTSFLTNASYDDSGLIPISASGRFIVNEKIEVGADLGYAFQIQSDFPDKGGIYYALKAQYQISKSFGLITAYRAVIIDDIVNFNLGFISIGLMASF